MAVFGLKYWAEFRSKHHGVLWRVEIAERGYSGVSEEMVFDGGEPLKITWEKRGDEFYTPVKASEATINIQCRENFHYLALFTADPRRFRVSVLRSGKLYWRGFVTADLYSESFSAPPYTVTIKAVDGFNLLSSYIFCDLMTIGTTGLRSLWDLLFACLSLLELDMEISDWLDLYGDGMNESLSPLRQTYIDLERLYFVYEEPTYRDILELCLLPFACQIFQSGGALHLRRAVSLYQSARPVTFFDIGTEFPTGIVITDERNTHLVAERGVNVVTSSGRDVVDDMWSSGIYVMGDGTLDIVPALRKVTVDVRNKSLGNLAVPLGFFNVEAWSDPYGFIDISDEGDALCFTGDDDRKNSTVITAGKDVEQCNYPLIWEFMLRTYHREWSAYTFSQPSNNYSVSVHYGVKVTGAGATYYLAESGDWSQSETDIVSEVKTGNEQSIKIEINGIPCDGKWQFYIRQTLIGKVTRYDSNRGSTSSGHLENATFSAMSLTIDAGDIYEKGLNYESLINPANNSDMSIILPVSDIPAIPNDRLLYALYFLTADGNPTRLWHTRGKSDYDTLVGHIVQGALRYKQQPSKRLTGEIFTNAHLDMNTVLKDEKFLGAAYSVNSIEMNALTDVSNCELTEMPRMITAEHPADGDDCIKVVDINFTIRKIVRCMDFLLIQSTGRRLYIFDTISRSLREIYSSSYDFEIFPAERGFVRYERQVFYYCDHRGSVLRMLTGQASSWSGDWATYDDGYFVLTMKGTVTSSVTGTRTFCYLYRPEVKVSNEGSTFRRGRDYTEIYGNTPLFIKTDNAIVVNTGTTSAFSDKRFHQFAVFKKLEDYYSIVSISDNYIIANAEDMSWFFRRTSVTDYTLVERIGRHTYHCDHTLSEVAICYDTPFVWDIRSQRLTSIMNMEGAAENIMGLYYIYGELYIVRESAIHKYIPQT